MPTLAKNKLQTSPTQSNQETLWTKDANKYLQGLDYTVSYRNVRMLLWRRYVHLCIKEQISDTFESTLFVRNFTGPEFNF